jgi:hypothetical protein
MRWTNFTFDPRAEQPRSTCNAAFAEGFRQGLID